MKDLSVSILWVWLGDFVKIAELRLSDLQTFVVRLQRIVLRAHTPLVLLLNIFLTAFSFCLALGLRFDFELNQKFTFEYVGIPLIVLCIVRAIAYSYYELNRGYWRYVSTNEAVRIVKAHALSSLLFAAAVGIIRIPGFPRSLVFLEFALSILFAMGARLLVRLCCEKYLSKASQDGGEVRDIVVVGAGVSGHLLIKTLHGIPNTKYRPVALFDDTAPLRGSAIHGVPIVGPTSELSEFLEHNPRVGAVIVAIPVISTIKLQEIEKVCANYHLPLKRLQSFEDIACNEHIEPQSPRTIEQVLSRETDVEHEDDIRTLIVGKRVLVTGAGGSIGSELVRQLITFAPSQIVLVDKCEYNLFSIQQELRGDKSDVKKIYSLATIQDKDRMNRIFSEYRPQMVFHAAAYKHVPLLEANCYEAFQNNIVGTRILLEVSRRYGAERFVLISTDKAVDPSSVMGCTKRIAELMVGNSDGLPAEEVTVNGMNGSGAKGEKARGMSTAVVRFGNVINSAGSVIPVFKKQILSGGPITVTHPEMERYFMSIREAVRLVLTAGTLGDKGEVYLLDMGNPIKIVDVAKKLLALYGRRDIPIVYTGLRPGEKLTESLYSSSELRTNSQFRKVFIVRGRKPQRLDVFEWVSAVREQLPHLNDLQVEAVIRTYVSNSENVEAEGLPEVARVSDEVAARVANA